MKERKVLCISGGSGAGKSTLAAGLAATLHDLVSVLGLDEYQRPKEQVPLTPSGRRNYDHPDAVDFLRFANDLRDLRSGRDVTLTRRHKSRTVDEGVRQGETMVIPSRKLIVVEGYLALWHPDALAQYDLKVFLDAPSALRVGRRLWAKDPQYVSEVLVPMHDQFIEPTKRYADVVIDIEPLTRAEVLARTFREIDERKFLY